MPKATRTADRQVLPYRFFRAQVLCTSRLSPHLMRVTFGGADLAGFDSDGPDQRVKLFFPHPGQVKPVFPTGEQWWLAWREMPEEERAVVRTYTIRRHRPAQREVDVDFVLHGDTGPASRWAARARPGDQVALWGPRAEYAPPPDAGWQLIVGDETALPAIGALVESLPDGVPAKVYVEVADAREEQDLETRKDVQLTWLHRDGMLAGRSDVLVDAVRGTTFGPGRPYAWIAGEAAMVRTLRRHLVNERGVDRRWIYFSGYWRYGCPEDQRTE